MRRDTSAATFAPPALISYIIIKITEKQADWVENA
jgi:hypothetical protein